MRFDVAIVGAGVMGSAIAWFLSRNPQFQGNVVLIERDPTFHSASSSLSASAIRQQFSTPVSIAMSQFGWDFISSAEATLGRSFGLEERGYLMLGNVHQAFADVELFGPDELARRFSWLNTSDVATATWCSHREGWFDGPALHAALLTSARQSGCKFIAGTVVGFEFARADGCRSVTAVALEDGTRIEADHFVNAAGAWSGKLHADAVSLPISAKKRDVFLFSCDAPPADVPMVWDPSGLWFRPEGGGFMCGRAPDPEQDPDDAELIVDYARFESELWPLLAHRVSAFEAIRLTGGWAGYYELCSFDQNGFVGPVSDCANLLLACGFSGHGMQHAPAVGRGIAELIVHGDYLSLDLSPLHHDRLERNTPLIEQQIA
jgi:glycine/D-amino acid oxidase-like deaminating enzyme